MFSSQLMISVPPALVIYTLGSGFNAFARSLLSSLVESHMIGTLFTTLAMMDTTGSLLAGPMVAGTFSWSLKFTGMARGLPYMFSLVICSLAMLALARVGARSTVEDEECRPILTGNRRKTFQDRRQRLSSRQRAAYSVARIDSGTELTQCCTTTVLSV